MKTKAKLITNKKHLIIAAILTFLCILPANAQQLKFGIEAGSNWSHYKNNKSKGEQVGSMGVGFQVSGTVDYEFKHHWMLMSGLTFMQTRSSMMLFDTGLPFFSDTEIKLNHLNIPIKVGYNIHINKKLSLIPYVGAYGSINFNAGKCHVKETSLGTTNHWKPMDGHSYIVPTDLPHEYEATIDAFRRWNYGAMGGMKAVIGSRYTVSLQYYESIKKIQKQCNLRNYGYQLNIGYQF